VSNDGAPRDVTKPRFRPDVTWICGHSDLGFSCSLGPTANGKCDNQNRLSSDDQAVDNSACSSCELACHTRNGADGSHGPWQECAATVSAPCIPLRSPWSFRSTLALNLAIATAGILLCLMSLPQREDTFVPGGLSSQHAQILENRVVSQRCSLCHPNSHTISPTTGAIASQDELCTRCHEGHLPNLHLRSPHDMDRTALRKLTEDVLSSRGFLISTTLSSTLSSRSPSDLYSDTDSPAIASLLASSERETTCASCHVEHHGRQQDLQAITDARCQACHAQQFESFENGHPEFNDYPVAQPRRIAFTHQAHLEQHFAKKNESFDCSKCHVDSRQRGGVGSVFRTLGFETACARCHNAPITAATADGWVLLQLPSIQPQDAQQSTSGLSDWPTSAQFGYEGNVPLAMRALLMADPNTDQALGRLPESGDIKSMSDYKQMGREATLSIATGTRSLISEVANSGHVAWRSRLESVLSKSLARELTSREVRLVDDLCAGLPPDIFRQMEQNWFGNESHGIASAETGDLSRQLPNVQLVSAQEDEPLLGASNDESEADLLGGPQPKSERPSSQSNTQANAPSSDEDLLLGNDVAPSAASSRQKLTKLRGAIHVAQGGWYLDNETLSLRYMPRGHDDPTLAAWCEFATLLANAVQGDGASSHGELSRQVPGGCVQCHVLGTSDANSTSFQSPWTSMSKAATVRTLTKFDHTPHLTLPTLSDCKYCHQLDSSSNAKSYRQFTSVSVKDPAAGLPLPTCEFKSMHLEQCSACHRPNAASTGCTQCHNYHVTQP
jgi:Cytochrome c554 and c-prime